MPPLRTLASFREGLAGAALSPFQHAPFPLAHTLGEAGDPGLLGPGSVSWRLLGDVSAFIGGIRGLLIQAAHPEVAAGVGDHSRYREDPLGRLSRTSAYITVTTYGSLPEVARAVERVRKAHSRVRGVSSRGVPYDASDPAYTAWVHNALTDSFLAAHSVFGGSPLSDAEADRFVLEQTRVGALLESSPMPQTRGELSEWIRGHPALAPSPEMQDAIAFLMDPPLRPAIRLGYQALLEAAISTIPTELTAVLGISPKPGARVVGHGVIRSLRWALGYSPSWSLALERVGAALPEGFHFRDRPAVATS